MDAMIGREFPSLEQRMLYYYKITMPAFIPVQTAGIPITSQEQCHAFLTAMLHKVYGTPTLIGLKITPDAWYPDFALNKTNPDLVKQMRKILASVDKLYLNLIKIGQLGTLDNGKLRVRKEDLKFAKRTLSVFAALGLQSQVEADHTLFWSEAYPDMLPAFQLLAKDVQDRFNNNNDRVSGFRRGLSGDDALRIARAMFDGLLTDDPHFQRLFAYLAAHGYRPHAEGGHDIHRLNFIKNSGKPDLKVCSPEAAKHYWGLSVQYDFRRKNQIAIHMRLPRYKTVLEAFDDLSEVMQEIIVTHTKRCDGCRYCVQTDKTGTRPLAAIPVKFRDQRYKLCPLYPVWGYQWTDINEAQVDQIITILESVDGIYRKEGVI